MISCSKAARLPLALLGVVVALVALPGPDALPAARAQDAVPILNIADITVIEGDTGTVNALFSVTLSAPVTSTVSVDYFSSDGTATAPGDYLPCAGTLSFEPGNTLRTISCQVKGDTLDEPPETFLLNLTNSLGATLARSQATATISDSDPVPALSISDAQVSEGTSGTASAIFVVRLSAASGRLVSVRYASSDGTATAPGDYQAVSGSLSFAPGETLKRIQVSVRGDSISEPDETFQVTLSGAANADLADSVAQGLISNGGTPLPTVSVTSATLNEGNSGSSSAIFSVTLSTAVSQTVTVAYASADGTASAGSDYEAISGQLVFPPGEAVLTLTVAILGDTRDEPNESFSLLLNEASNAQILLGQGIGTIIDDDAPPTMSIGNCTSAEGGNCLFTVVLSATSDYLVTATFTTSDDLATAPADYISRTGTLAFEPGTSARVISIPINRDGIDEAEEGFFATIGNPVNATINGSGQGRGTISDDTPLPTLSAGDCAVAEGTVASDSCRIVVTLSVPSARQVSVQYDTADGTATAPADYAPRSGRLIFAPGTLTQTVVIRIESDLVQETTENAGLLLSNPVNAVIGKRLGQIVISDFGRAPERLFLPLAGS